LKDTLIDNRVHKSFSIEPTNLKLAKRKKMVSYVYTIKYSKDAKAPILLNWGIFNLFKNNKRIPRGFPVEIITKTYLGEIYEKKILTSIRKEIKRVVVKEQL